MRILIAHEALAGGGGVESYLACLLPALRARGHELSFLHDNPAADPGPTSLRVEGVPTFGVADAGLTRALATARAWRPDVCFSHNMGRLEIDRGLAAIAPTVKMMHGYFGTCISGHKAHGFPSVVPCDRTFGATCLGLYLPRRCGQRRPSKLLAGYTWARRQRALLDCYAQIVVASEHMGREYRRNGVAAERVTVAPLFPTVPAGKSPRPVPADPQVLFLGRMTRLKGGDVLVRAAAAAGRRLGQPVHLVMAGDGPERSPWQRLADRLQVRATFTGWRSGSEVVGLLRGASVVAVPSLWPEPFGLAGLEAAAHGVPSVAFDCGGISEWLRHDVSGRLVPEAGDVEGLGEAIAAVAGDPALNARLGAGARGVAAELTRDAHVARLEGVLDRASASCVSSTC